MRVPVYERQGNINPRQAAQVSPLMPAGDYGASVAQNVAGLATRLQQMQDATQDARTLELFNKFKADSQEYHENPDKGLYNTRQGYMAQGMYAEADEWLRKRGEEYARTIKSDRAKKNFRTMAEQYIQQRGAANSRYEADQVKKYQVEQAQIAYKNGLNEIALNPYCGLACFCFLLSYWHLLPLLPAKSSSRQTEAIRWGTAWRRTTLLRSRGRRQRRNVAPASRLRCIWKASARSAWGISRRMRFVQYRQIF